MTNYSWASGVTGTWSTAADWGTTGAVPSSSNDQATISSGTVIVNGSYTIQMLTLGGGTISGAASTDVITATYFNLTSGTTSTVSNAVITAKTQETWSNATINITSGASVSLAGQLYADGSTINISGGAKLTLSGSTQMSSSPVININGGTLVDTSTHVTYNSTYFPTVNFGSSGGALILNTTSVSGYTSSKITGFKSTDVLSITSENASDTYTATYNATAHTLVITDTTTNTTIATFTDFEADSSFTSGTYTLTNSNGTVSLCFLPGTLIETPTGHMPVETLTAGCPIVVQTPTGKKESLITWAGRQNVNVDVTKSAELAGYPVRILKNAISDGVPFKDLLVTAEHCLFIKGGFIPARMLVNGYSIVYDRSITSYDYFHIETADHSVIFADGMTTESYLDTGNRAAFSQPGTLVRLGSAPKKWNVDSAHALTVDVQTVKPIFDAILSRANALSFACVDTPVDVTQDPDIKLITASGTTILPTRTVGEFAMFQIDGDVSEVTLVSRTFCPASTIGPFVDDRRELGVLVGQIILWGSSARTNVTAHLCDSTLAGWAVLDHDTLRWTTGSATLPFEHTRRDGVAMLAIQICDGGPYTAAKPMPLEQLAA